MRDNYNRPQMRGYWDAPKSKEESRYEMLYLISACSLIRSFVCSLVQIKTLCCLFCFANIKTASMYYFCNLGRRLAAKLCVVSYSLFSLISRFMPPPNVGGYRPGAGRGYPGRHMRSFTR